MADLEKVIKGLECCAKNNCSITDCPYGKEDTSYCIERLSADALTLLKEQEEEIENLKQTCQSMMEGICLLKEQEEKKGQWIPIESPTGVEAFGVKEMTVMNVRCSVCGSEEDVSFTGYKYCPRCGANMDAQVEVR